jgi:hypothetical protein
MREAGLKNMLIGGLIACVGALLTYIGYNEAGHGGGKYVIWWGAVVYGGIQFFRGLAQHGQGQQQS